MRYYRGTHYNKLVDLYNGEYFMDYSSRRGVSAELNAAAADPSWQYEHLGVGDIVYKTIAAIPPRRVSTLKVSIQ